MKSFDDIRIEEPLGPLDGNETFVVNQGGVTRGGFLSVLRSWLQTTIQLTISNITDISNVLPVAGTAAEIVAATETAARTFSPKTIADGVYQTPIVITSATTLDAASCRRRTIVTDSATAFALTVPTLTLPLGVEFSVVNKGAGTVSVTPSTGVPINGSDSLPIDVLQYEHVTFTYVATDTWISSKARV